MYLTLTLSHLTTETNRQIEQLHYYLEKTCQSLKDLETQKNEYDEWQTLETRRQALEFLSLRKDRSHLKQRLSTVIWKVVQITIKKINCVTFTSSSKVT